MQKMIMAVPQATRWRKDMMTSTFAKRKKNTEKNEITSTSSSRMKLRKIKFVIRIQSMLGFVTLSCSGIPSATVREL